MENIFTVGINYTGEYSITIRRLAKNAHWKRAEGNPSCIYDSRDPNPRMFAILFEGTESDAKSFAEVIKAAYALKNVVKVTVKSNDE